MSYPKRLLITGGAGFIGSTLVRKSLEKGFTVGVLDAFTYAGRDENLENLSSTIQIFRVDLRDPDAVLRTIEDFTPDAIAHLAAESHVDNSIRGPKVFLETNVMGTFNLLEAARRHCLENEDFRFLHVSTDEVFGSLGDTGYFSEQTPYQPNSPYSSSKAASDHLVRAWHHTYRLPTITTNCSNNYGPRQFPEKLIPVMILNAISDKPLPVYGEGKNVRDWIHVEDHAEGILLALERGRIGESYCFGGRSERTNLEVVKGICSILDELRPKSTGKYASQITFVTDRAGHDWRYAIDDSKAQTELGYKRKFKSFEDGLLQTVRWYLDNPSWIASVATR